MNSGLLPAPPRVKLRGASPPQTPPFLGAPRSSFFFFQEFFCSGKAKLGPETMKIGFSVKNCVYTLSGKLIARRNDQF